MAKSDDEKALALAALKANADNVSETSRDTGISRRTIARWANGEDINDSVGGKAQRKVKELDDKLEQLAHKILDTCEEKIEKASLKDSMVSAGIAIDKKLLLRGQANSITSHLRATDEEKAAARADFESRRAEIYRRKVEEVKGEM